MRTGKWTYLQTGRAPPPSCPRPGVWPGWVPAAGRAWAHDLTTGVSGCRTLGERLPPVLCAGMGHSVPGGTAGWPGSRTRQCSHPGLYFRPQYRTEGCPLRITGWRSQDLSFLFMLKACVGSLAYIDILPQRQRSTKAGQTWAGDPGRPGVRADPEAPGGPSQLRQMGINLSRGHSHLRAFAQAMPRGRVCPGPPQSQGHGADPAPCSGGCSQSPR